MADSSSVKYALIYFLICGWFGGTSQDVSQPSQPEFGPGGNSYDHSVINTIDRAEDMDGYWMYLPSESVIPQAPIVVFLHGYGAINPMIYGRWIRHLVQKGNVVIYPRYQEHLFSPPPEDFGITVSTAVRNALSSLKNEYGHKNTANIIYSGHSYGAVLAAFIGVKYDSLQLPMPKALLLAEPGTGPFTGCRLETYDELPEEVKMVVIVGVNDYTVGEYTGRLIFSTASNVRDKIFVRQFADSHGKSRITASHYEPYALDKEFDTGHRNFTFTRAEREAKEDAVDYYCYWKMLDSMIECIHFNKSCDLITGKNEKSGYMGTWSDGDPIVPLEIYTADMESISNRVKSN